MNLSINIDKKMNEYGEFTKIHDVLIFWGYTIIKPIVSMFDFIFIKGFLALAFIIFTDNDPKNYELILDMFKVPLDLVVLLMMLWCFDIVTGLIRAKFIKKEMFIPAKVLMWFMRGVLYMVGLGMFSAFINVAAKYFGDMFLQAQAFVFLILAFTELWSNVRNLVGHNANKTPLGKALISYFSGSSLKESLREIIQGDNNDNKNN